MTPSITKARAETDEALSRDFVCLRCFWLDEERRLTDAVLAAAERLYKAVEASTIVLDEGIEEALDALNTRQPEKRS